MHASASAETWPLAGLFSISRGTSEESHVLHVRLESDGIIAQGEAESAEYAAADAIERVAECQAFLDANAQGLTRTALQQKLPAGPIRNAIDCALWDLEAKRSGKRVWELAAIPRAAVRTLYTLSLDTPASMARAAAAHADWPWLKLKLGGDGDMERVQAVRGAAPQARLLVDANGGWTLAQLAAYAPRLAALGVAVIEQPLPPGADAALRHKWPDAPLICADESCTDRASLEHLAGGYGMINIKLDKAGGLTEALALAREAHRRGFKIMVGCNLGTSLAMAPALLIATLAEVVDLDGPLLLAGDRSPALVYDRDLVHWPETSLWG